MLFYGKPFKIDSGGWGEHSLKVRDVVCMNCYNTIDKQKAWDKNKEYVFSSSEKNEWKFCPYCGENFY